MSSEAEARAAVVAAALSWVGTPYVHRGRIKGVGVDCASLILCSFVEAEEIADRELPQYEPQWHLNQDAQRYLAVILDHAVEKPGPPERMPRPADVAVWKIGRTFSHGAIVIEWPRIVHATIRTLCHEDDALDCAWLANERSGTPRAVRFFSHWG